MRSVTLLGHAGEPKWTRDEAGLHVLLPKERPCKYAFALKVTGLQQVRRAEDGLTLEADAADLHGTKLRVEARGAESSSIGAWDDPSEWLSWQVKVPAGGTYEIEARVAAAAGDTVVEVQIGDTHVTGTVPKTASWDDFQTVSWGRVAIPKRGTYELRVRASSPADWKAVNLAWVRLRAGHRAPPAN